jgi:hypothetical protein
MKSVKKTIPAKTGEKIMQNKCVQLELSCEDVMSAMEE